MHEKINKQYRHVCDLLHRRKVLDAIDLLREMVKQSNLEFFNNQLDELLDTYQNILRHSFLPAKDPERDKVFRYLIRSLLEMADELKEHLHNAIGQQHTYRMRSELLQSRRVERGDAAGIIGNLTFDRELAGILKDVKVGDGADDSVREDALIGLFNIIWLANRYTDSEMELLEAVCDSDVLPWHDKALVVSALTLSLLRYFDPNKLLILLRFVNKKEPFVWERAMVGVFLGYLKFNDRYDLYPVLGEKTRALQAFPGIEQNLEAILIQFTKSKETDKVRKKWEDEILPEMIKMRPKIEEKLDLQQISSDDFGEEKNPEWETVFEDVPDLLNKLQEFTELQMDGMDVFISAFSPLKGFPFFRQISNWFVPFYAENQALSHVLKSTTEDIDLTPLIERLETTYFMCNSDKYSFCLNLGLVPDEQKSMMMNMLNAEMKNISELEKGEELINSFAMTKSIYTQYFQDLYRFFKLHPWREEFDDVFALQIDLYETTFVNQLVADKKTIRNIAEFYFDKKFYHDALKVFLAIIKDEPSDIELFEKIAFCYEKTGSFNQAYSFYQKADLIESDRLWIVRKLAFCCKMLGRWQDALSYYQQAAQLAPDDLNIQASTGQCLIHLERYDEALQVYFKVEVLAPENHRIRRPLAWCSFLSGKLETARDYLERLLSEEPGNKYDLMNLAHVCWCMDQTEESADLYAKSIRAWSGFKEFETSFNEDRKHLARFGITETDMDLMIDYARLKSQ